MIEIICQICKKKFLDFPYNKNKRKYCSKKCLRISRIKHNMSYTRFYGRWQLMVNRCNNSNDTRYKDYGGRGITVCSRWLKFENFRDDMYLSYKKHCKKYGKNNTQIDRINNNGNYKLNNCKYSTRKEQCNNRKNNHYITYKQQTLNITQWAEKLNINRSDLYSLIQRGKDIKKIFI